MEFKAFADDSTVVNIHGDAFAVTNDPERIVLTGTLELTRDKAGLTAALALQQTIASILNVLQHDPALPEHVGDEPAAPTGKIKNPFEG
ncbi:MULTISPECIES: hypothetical protein [Burkholderia cepacia complex]|uniref:hypothetical protein n=1 Tax=Burkholderia cepacia complex TaxID=87882 RepID=UPI0006794161|nr:hypothetical protein [Burkholderia cenocepacia]KWU25756.1 hypothetical protein AS149_28380 [Burkholderia cenocepacia]CAG2266081.1 hypothetical protein BCCR75389_01240 [Burkholderia cenocepacia]CAG2266271.1 hypothetical protein BCCR75386_01255 [Burkholderia cenocepacia]CAG2266457.1 hypothetical protein BCCR75388_01256 [Burkholderia cenocepacia]CAG2266644.1 hypothetical protein BCCR75384_01255 [Burkholderia cenocepacia]